MNIVEWLTQASTFQFPSGQKIASIFIPTVGQGNQNFPKSKALPKCN